MLVFSAPSTTWPSQVHGCLVCVFSSFVERVSRAGQASVKLEILLPPSPECWAPLCKSTSLAGAGRPSVGGEPYVGPPQRAPPASVRSWENDCKYYCSSFIIMH